MARFYPGRSLKELFRGSMSYRELSVFIRHLPADSWTQTIIRDARLAELANPEREQEPEQESAQKFGPWALINYQMASLTDAINRLRYVAEVTGNIKDPQPPDPTPRPGLAPKSERRNPEAVVLYLEQMRAAREGRSAAEGRDKGDQYDDARQRQQGR